MWQIESTLRPCLVPVYELDCSTKLFYAFSVFFTEIFAAEKNKLGLIKSNMHIVIYNIYIYTYTSRHIYTSIYNIYNI